MNMSFYELYVWVLGLDFPSLLSIWTWLITVPWWLAILTVWFIIFAVRITLNMTFYFINWLFDWTFRAGEKLGKWLQIAKQRLVAAIEFGRLVKHKLFR